MKIKMMAVTIALVYNVVNFILWRPIQRMPNVTSMIYIIIFSMQARIPRREKELGYSCQGRVTPFLCFACTAPPPRHPVSITR